MQKIKFFISFFLFLGMASVFMFFGATASNAQSLINNIDMVQTDKYMYMSEPNEGVVYVFDNQNGGAFVKKIYISGSDKPLNMLVYNSITIVANHYILIANTDGNQISIINENGVTGSGPELDGFIQTPKKPYDMAFNDGYLLVTVADEPGVDYLPFSIQLTEGANGKPQRTGSDYQWTQANVANMYFVGNEKIFRTGLNQVEIFGTLSSGLDIETFYVTSGIPSYLSSGSAGIDSFPYSDYALDSTGTYGYYVGSDGPDNKNVHIIEVGSNDQLGEIGPLSDRTNSVALSHDAILYIGMHALDGPDLIQYEVFPGSTPILTTAMIRYLLPSTQPLLTNGLSASANAVYAVTPEFVYLLSGDTSGPEPKPVYSFIHDSENPSDFLAISDFNVRNITNTSADVCWEYDYPATTFYLQWGEDQTSLDASNSQVEINNHGYCYTIEGLNPLSPGGLSPNKTYYVQVKSYLDSIPSTSYLAKSNIISFTTLGDGVVTEPKPDLEVTNISFTTDALTNTINTTGKLSVTIKNNGAALTTSDSLIHWQEDADFGAFQTGDSFSPNKGLPSFQTPLNTGEEIVFTWDGKFSNAGGQRVLYHVDSKNLLEEENESNNILEKEVYISEPGEVTKLPDLAVGKVDKNITSTGTVSLDFYYRNMGEAKTPNSVFHVSVSVDGNQIDDLKVSVNEGDADFGQNVMRVYPSIPLDLDPGTHLVSFVIDSNNEVTEAKEDNNVYKMQVYIPEPDLDSTKAKDHEKIVEMAQKARELMNNHLDIILDQIQELRDVIKEQNAKLKYLNKLSTSVSILTDRMQSAINNFITYGVDNNTKALGEGERAAVIYSYKAAYNKLPETEEELSDAIKIANGRWPGTLNPDAEKRAKAQFQEIYKKIPDMDNPSDNAAVTVMAYGLRQSADNRNLESEKQGIKTFVSIYGYAPKTTNDWNMMQAITYSGASRGIDTDGDFLIDERETALGTDPNNRDTDGDGYIDGVEVANGFDPLTAPTK